MGYTFTIPLLIVNFIVYVPGALASCWPPAAPSRERWPRRSRGR